MRSNKYKYWKKCKRNLWLYFSVVFKFFRFLFAYVHSMDRSWSFEISWKKTHDFLIPRTESLKLEQKRNLLSKATTVTNRRANFFHQFQSRLSFLMCQGESKKEQRSELRKYSGTSESRNHRTNLLKVKFHVDLVKQITIRNPNGMSSIAQTNKCNRISFRCAWLHFPWFFSAPHFFFFFSRNRLRIVCVCNVCMVPRVSARVRESYFLMSFRSQLFDSFTVCFAINIAFAYYCVICYGNDISILLQRYIIIVVLGALEIFNENERVWMLKLHRMSC